MFHGEAADLFDRARMGGDHAVHAVRRQLDPAARPLPVARPERWDALPTSDEIDLPATPYRSACPRTTLAARLRHGYRSASDRRRLGRGDARAARDAPTTATVTDIDAKVGELDRRRSTKRASLDDTIVIFTSDHGDMLGERGLWYKMSTLDHSMRVPMVMAGPGIAHGTSPEPCSLVDLLPTMLDWAAPGAWPALGAELDGRSLVAAAAGADVDVAATALGEYCAEGASQHLSGMSLPDVLFLQSSPHYHSRYAGSMPSQA